MLSALEERELGERERRKRLITLHLLASATLGWHLTASTNETASPAAQQPVIKAKATGSHSYPETLQVGTPVPSGPHSWFFCSINFRPRCWPFRGTRTSGILTSKDPNLLHHEGQARIGGLNLEKRRKPDPRVSALGQAGRCDLGMTAGDSPSWE